MFGTGCVQNELGLHEEYLEVISGFLFCYLVES